MKKISCITIIYLSVSIVSIAQISEVKILPIDGAPGDEFGQSVSISGDYTIVGARWDDDNGMMSGSAYIFQRDGANWIEEQKLLATDGAEGDWFGHSVSISGDYVIVGAVGDDDYGLVSGAAYIFRREGTSWIEDQKLTSSDGAQGDNFGMSVSISGDYAILGAPFNDDNGMMSGSAYIFRRDSTIWLEEEKLTASDGAAEDLFGFSVSISGDYAIVGAFQDDDSGDLSGSAYIFRRDSTIWLEEEKLTASDGAAGDYFGCTVSILGDYVLIGASGDNTNGMNAGSAYIYSREGTSWIDEQKLLAPDGQAGDKFGISVSFIENYAIIGAFQDGDNGTESGSAYIFQRDGANWIEEQKLLATDGAEGDQFGFSVSISGDYAIVGARWDDDNGDSSGSAYIYKGFVVDIEYEELVYPLYFSLQQNYPNPFNPNTTIRYDIPERSITIIKLYDVLGNEVRTLVEEEMSVGSYQYELNATELPSGVYFYQLKAVPTGRQAGDLSTGSGQSFVVTKKMVLIK